VSRLRECWG